MFEEEQFDEEGMGAGPKRRNKQKKRTVVGEEKTAATFIVISILILLEMLIYPIALLVMAEIDDPARVFSAEAVPQIIKVEK